MDAALAGELAGLATAFLWAATGIMLKSLTSKLNLAFLNSIRCLSSALFCVPLVLLGGGFGMLAETPLRSIAILLAGTVVNIGIGELLFLYSVRYLDLSIAYPISLCGYPLVTMFTAFLFLGEQLAPAALAGVFLVVAGLYFTAFPTGGLVPKLSLVSSKQRLGLVLGIVSVIFYGAGTVVVRVGIQDINLQLANFLRFSVIGLLLVPFTLRHWATIGTPDCAWRNVWLGALNGALALGLAGVIFLFALNNSGAAMTSVLTSTSPLFLLPMSLVFLKEKLTRKLIAGVIISVAGITLIFLPNLL